MKGYFLALYLLIGAVGAEANGRFVGAHPHQANHGFVVQMIAWPALVGGVWLQG